MLIEYVRSAEPNRILISATVSDSPEPRNERMTTLGRVTSRLSQYAYRDQRAGHRSHCSPAAVIPARNTRALIGSPSTGYNLTITPPDVTLNPEKAPRDYLLILAPVLILVVIGWLGVWSNHFESGFHFDDVSTIVANPYVQHAFRGLSGVLYESARIQQGQGYGRVPPVAFGLVCDGLQTGRRETVCFSAGKLPLIRLRCLRPVFAILAYPRHALPGGGFRRAAVRASSRDGGHGQLCAAAGRHHGIVRRDRRYADLGRVAMAAPAKAAAEI